MSPWALVPAPKQPHLLDEAAHRLVAGVVDQAERRARAGDRIASPAARVPLRNRAGPPPRPAPGARGAADIRSGAADARSGAANGRARVSDAGGGADPAGPEARPRGAAGALAEEGRDVGGLLREGRSGPPGAPGGAGGKRVRPAPAGLTRNRRAAVPGRGVDESAAEGRPRRPLRRGRRQRTMATHIASDCISCGACEARLLAEAIGEAARSRDRPEPAPVCRLLQKACQAVCPVECCQQRLRVQRAVPAP